MPDPAEPAAVTGDPISDLRWVSGHVDAFVALDNFAALTAAVLGIIGEDRVMNLTSTYIHDQVDDLSDLRHSTGLRKGGHRGYPLGHLVVHDDDAASLTVWLTRRHRPGAADHLAFGAEAYDAATEQEVSTRYLVGSSRRRDLTRVRLWGHPGQPASSDRVEVQHWNHRGVQEHTILTFVEPDYADLGRTTQTQVLVVGQTREQHSVATHEREETVFATLPGPVEEQAAQAALAEVIARDDVATAWLVEETVTRERRSVGAGLTVIPSSRSAR